MNNKKKLKYWLKKQKEEMNLRFFGQLMGCLRV